MKTGCVGEHERRRPAESNSWHEAEAEFCCRAAFYTGDRRLELGRISQVFKGRRGSHVLPCTPAPSPHSTEPKGRDDQRWMGEVDDICEQGSKWKCGSTQQASAYVSSGKQQEVNRGERYLNFSKPWFFSSRKGLIRHEHTAAVRRNRVQAWSIYHTVPRCEHQRSGLV